MNKNIFILKTTDGVQMFESTFRAYVDKSDHPTESQSRDHRLRVLAYQKYTKNYTKDAEVVKYQ